MERIMKANEDGGRGRMVGWRAVHKERFQVRRGSKETRRYLVGVGGGGGAGGGGGGI